jgi:hypothetical protein
MTVFVTRKHAKLDRIACPWLVQRFVDPNAEFVYVAGDRVLEFAGRENAVPFDVPGVELGHQGSRCSFDAFITKYGLTDPALLLLAEIVRGADTGEMSLRPESSGLHAIASGFAAQSPARYSNDHELLAAQRPLYDALYEYCRTRGRHD